MHVCAIPPICYHFIPELLCCYHCFRETFVSAIQLLPLGEECLFIFPINASLVSKKNHFLSALVSRIKFSPQLETKKTVDELASPFFKLLLDLWLQI
ncbi:hypothetical protein HNY73_012745 [Argiope bruennichi]|uniref:Uncharacterized protein n=1 Tax=Argiope bruennichi TaxID=94029 RepID=A0A8T0EVW5_ARGBR|nr:hypothetical protein HNY73_012745 [Argiope bruennichi]